jgi:hypothetical protein
MCPSPSSARAAVCADEDSWQGCRTPTTWPPISVPSSGLNFRCPAADEQLELIPLEQFKEQWQVQRNELLSDDPHQVMLNRLSHELMSRYMRQHLTLFRGLYCFNCSCRPAVGKSVLLYLAIAGFAPAGNCWMSGCCSANSFCCTELDSRIKDPPCQTTLQDRHVLCCWRCDPQGGDCAAAGGGQGAARRSGS